MNEDVHKKIKEFVDFFKEMFQKVIHFVRHIFKKSSPTIDDCLIFLRTILIRKSYI